MLLCSDQRVSVSGRLAARQPRRRKAGTIRRVVETTFQQKQKILAGNSFLPGRALKIVAKLTFENEIDAFDFLLFAELLAISGQRLAAAHRIAMLSGRLRATLFTRTRGFVATCTLEEKFCSFAAAQPAHRIPIPSQSFLPPV